MKLNPKEASNIRNVLKEAFSLPAWMRVVVDDADLGQSWDDLTFGARSYDEALSQVIRYASGQHHLFRLLGAAVEAAPDNPDLATLLNPIRSFDRLRPDCAFNRPESLIFQNFSFENVADWIARLSRLRRRVCRVEPQPRSVGIHGYGTGFLVAPDVVLTNAHVAGGFGDQAEQIRQVRCRFDCEYSATGSLCDGAAIPLAEDWNILRSPVDALDFALIRLAWRAGDDSTGDGVRGFVVPAPHVFQEDEPLLILQHPMAEPQKLAFGSVTGPAEWPTDRVQYKVQTEGGSSGSPCSTQGLEVGAIHHWGGEASNQGVLMSSILSHLRQHPDQDRLRAAGLAHLLASAPT